MLSLLRRNSVLVTIAALLVASLVLLVGNTRGRHRIDPLGVVFLELVTPVSGAIAGASNIFASTWGGYVSLVGVRQENAWLRKRVRELETRADQTVDLESQNSRLQALLDLRESMP